MLAVALRGNWKKEENEEDGNFLFFVKWKSTFDKALEDHLRHAPKNAQFTLPHIQNKLLVYVRKSPVTESNKKFHGTGVS